MKTLNNKSTLLNVIIETKKMREIVLDHLKKLYLKVNDRLQFNWFWEMKQKAKKEQTKQLINYIEQTSILLDTLKYFPNSIDDIKERNEIKKQLIDIYNETVKILNTNK